jgi:hypothetical protein
MRKISIGLYAGAFLLSLLIFLSGIYVGQLIDESSMKTISSEVQDVSQKVASVQLLLLMEANSSAFCPVYSSELDAIDDEVERVGYKLTYLEEDRQMNDPDLKKQYFVLQAESYLLSKKVREICDDKSVLLINFYSNEDCENCKAQGNEILKARDELSGKVNLKLFSFDGDLGSPVADAFARQYNVSSYPTIVIDGKAYPGYMTATEIEKLVE